MVFATDSFRGHESVSFFHDEATGLRSIVAVHSTAFGPAFGGCRMWPYATDEAAVRDVLRLSRGMSYKNAMAGLPFGGGKSVIIGDSRRQKSEALLRAFGRNIEGLGGRYITAEDVGISESDIEIVAQETRYVSGRRQRGAAAGGNPAPKTAFGVFQGMRAAAELKLGRTSLDGLTVAIQGVGQVGYHLCKLLHNEGVKLIVADVDSQSVERAVAEFDARAVATDEVLFVEADILSPCALGAVLTAESVEKIKASLIVGAANNQLASDEAGEALLRRGILYAPDYVVNGGGIISASLEYLGGHEEREVWARVTGIYETTRVVLIRAMREQRPANAIADEIAESRIVAARAARPNRLRRAS